MNFQIQQNQPHRLTRRSVDESEDSNSSKNELKVGEIENPGEGMIAGRFPKYVEKIIYKYHYE